MSQHVNRLQIGDTLDFKGPLMARPRGRPPPQPPRAPPPATRRTPPGLRLSAPTCAYQHPPAPPRLRPSHAPQKLPLDKIKERSQVGMVAGGSGLTPMLQVRAAAAATCPPLPRSRPTMQGACHA